METVNKKTENWMDRNGFIFHDLTNDEKSFLYEHSVRSFYKKGDIIFREGDKPTGLICLLEGKVKIFKEGVGGREQIVRMARPDGFIGYRALFAEENYIASSVAIEDSGIVVIEKPALMDILRQDSSA